MEMKRGATILVKFLTFSYNMTQQLHSQIDTNKNENICTHKYLYINVHSSLSRNNRVLVFYCHCDKLPQTQCLKTTQMYYITFFRFHSFLEAVGRMFRWLLQLLNPPTFIDSSLLKASNVASLCFFLQSHLPLTKDMSLLSGTHAIKLGPPGNPE